MLRVFFWKLSVSDLMLRVFYQKFTFSVLSIKVSYQKISVFIRLQHFIYLKLPDF